MGRGDLKECVAGFGITVVVLAMVFVVAWCGILFCDLRHFLDFASSYKSSMSTSSSTTSNSENTTEVYEVLTADE